MKKAIKLFSAFMVMASSLTFAQSVNFPKEESSPVKIFNKGSFENEWNLDSAEKNTPYYFNFFAESNNDKILKFEKTDGGLIIEPLESASGTMKIDFYRDGQVVSSSDVSTHGPNALLEGITGLVKPELVYSANITNKKKIWPVLVAVGLCCVKVKYTYASGNPPKHTTSIEFNCTCLDSKSKSAGVPVIVDGRQIYVDYMTITTDNNVKSNSLGLIVSK